MASHKRFTKFSQIDLLIADEKKQLTSSLNILYIFLDRKIVNRIRRVICLFVSNVARHSSSKKPSGNRTKKI